ncbi:MAG: SAM-dependent methyltransferase [Paenibacillus dendritiformis]|uniref:SAM-dependent methyltransferase n=1 Tax=Paenibacillus dendritiformis TaxID=130049 RepID=UPI00143E03AA|nr:SAM-dependent methyltransferase [Paenibacillus dendritiformis]MDU5141767.1 SAM-dependent methyltransferase [Paenibacillus dendritiformis]NKI22716.1 SAM-dependent methyltransferase [Paenibacillus dendritiformis]NRG01380.1 SAM-dependent methyltransferase [Paenibacillus dendritiformis]
MKPLTLNPVGKIRIGREGMFVETEPKYTPALKELCGFSHLQVLWWFDGCDNASARTTLETEKPYQKGPDTLGIFATRSPYRPNPIGLSTARILSIDEKNGIIQLAYLDAHEGSPVLDLKPYTPSLDRVETPRVPNWCAHWPQSLEESASFDWAHEFRWSEE